MINIVVPSAKYALKLMCLHMFHLGAAALLLLSVFAINDL